MSESFLETIKIVDGEIYNIEYHQKRYESVLESLGVDDFKELHAYINPPLSGIVKCRIVYDAKNLTASYQAYRKRDIASLKLVYDDKIEYDKKSTCRDDIDRLYGKKDVCDDILIVKNSLISDTSIANVAFYKDGIWYTPKQPLLMGTTRQRLLQSAKIVPKDIAVDELPTYSKVALLNAMIDFDIIQKNLKDVIC